MATSRHHPRHPKNQWLYVPIVAVAIAVVAAYLTRSQQPTSQTTNSRPTISIPTADGLTLMAELAVPSGTTLAPAVILVHSFGQDHHEWDSYLKDFTDNGFAVLAYDVRGFGASNLKSIPSDVKSWYNAMPDDVPAVIDYLQQQPRIDGDRINIIGAELGANIAYVASGSHLKIHRVVLLSPKLSAGVLDGRTVKDFSPAGVFGISDVESAGFLLPVMAYIHEPKQEFMTDNGPTVGVALVKDTSVHDRLFSWLKE